MAAGSASNPVRFESPLGASKNASDGGRVCVGDQFLTIDPRAGFESVNEKLDLVISSGGKGAQLTLRNVATIGRGL